MAVENRQEVSHARKVTAKEGEWSQRADRELAVLRRSLTQEKGQTETKDYVVSHVVCLGFVLFSTHPTF